MGLQAFEIAKLVKLPLPRPFRALSWGHPDILATPKELLPIFDKILLTDAGGVTESRRGKVKPGIVGNARIIFEAMGGSLTVYDYVKSYGVDETKDLNLYIDDNDFFDLVVDPGTSEHCFNVGTALLNMANHVNLGGFIYHMVPMCHWNHGFWNFSPCAFADFYEQNGFKIKEMVAEYRGTWLDVAARNKFEIQTKGRKLNLLCIAQRVSGKRIDFPTQYKFVDGRWN